MSLERLNTLQVAAINGCRCGRRRAARCRTEVSTHLAEQVLEALWELLLASIRPSASPRKPAAAC